MINTRTHTAARTLQLPPAARACCSTRLPPRSAGAARWSLAPAPVRPCVHTANPAPSSHAGDPQSAAWQRDTAAGYSGIRRRIAPGWLTRVRPVCRTARCSPPRPRTARRPLDERRQLTRFRHVPREHFHFEFTTVRPPGA